MKFRSSLHLILLLATLLTASSMVAAQDAEMTRHFDYDRTAFTF